MVKKKEAFGDTERARMRQVFNSMDGRQETFNEAWENGLFENRTGRLNGQGMDVPYKMNPSREWFEGDGKRYGFKKQTASIRKLKNAKAKKPEKKKYYKKTKHCSRNLDRNIVRFEMTEQEEHKMLMMERGLMPTAICKACNYHLNFKFMDNFDMAICWECAEGLRDGTVYSE